MTVRIHVNQHTLRANIRDDVDDPVIAVRVGHRTVYSNDVALLGPSRVVYRRRQPLSCGARIWVETEGGILVDGRDLVDRTACVTSPPRATRPPWTP